MAKTLLINYVKLKEITRHDLDQNISMQIQSTIWLAEKGHVTFKQPIRTLHLLHRIIYAYNCLIGPGPYLRSKCLGLNNGFPIQYKKVVR